MLLMFCMLPWLLSNITGAILVPPKRPEADVLKGALRTSRLVFQDGAEAHVSTIETSDEQTASFGAALLHHLHLLGVAAPQSSASLVVKIVTPLCGDEQVPSFVPAKSAQRLYIVVVSFSDTPGADDVYARRLLAEALRSKFFHPRLIALGIDGLRILAFNPYHGVNFTGSLVDLTGNDASEYEPARNMNGYPITASVWHFPPKVIVDVKGKMWGVDIRIYETLASLLNASRNLTVYEDNTHAGRENAMRHSDFIVNCRFIRIEQEFEADFLYPYEKCSYCIIVPKAPPIPLYKHLFFPFSSAVWCLLLPTAVFSAFLWCVIRKIRQRLFDSTAVDTASTVLLTLRVLITGSSGSFSSCGLEDKVTLLVLTLFSMVLLNGFQGSLTSHLAVPRSQPDIDTLQELDKSGLGVYIHPNTISLLLSNDQDDVLNRLRKKMVFLDSIKDVAERVLEAGNMSGAIDEVTGRVLVRQRALWAGGRPRLHLVPECLSPNYVAPFVRRGVPFAAAADRALQRLVEGGLTSRWAAEAADMLDATGQTLPPQQQLQPHAALTAAHLALSFVVLGSGLCLAVAAFAAEMLFSGKSPSQTESVYGCKTN